jgi:BirA family biotin operon repressor/biotin-[acetyl-CoA-carboxylase] ligase
MYIAETDSTNNLLRQRYLDEDDLFTIHTDFQTAGRGQQGNGWESEKGKNLLFSTLLRDWHVSINRQFIINQIVSLSLYYTVRAFLTEDLQPFLAIKWPNDLYYKDKKLAGILIENIWQTGQVSRSIAGIGLNVNQTVFRSQAPNPVSLCQIAGHEMNRQDILQLFLQSLQHYRCLMTDPSYSSLDADIHSAYMRALYRREGFYRWEEREVSSLPTMPQMTHTSNQFLASIHSVLPSGELVLLTTDNQQRIYHFKQVRYVL